ncbi:MAG: CPBP family intramembrane glutamic endopeptidase [Verrucomicrobiota bacterium]
MCGDSPTEVLKVWLYAMASVLLGAWFAPFLYNAGKALAEVSSVKQTNGPLQWLAGICRAADFPKFFETSLLGAAVLLFLPFIHWLQAGRQNFEGRHTPDRARGWNSGQRLHGNPRGLRHAATGFLLVTVVFLGIAGVLTLAGVFTWNHHAGSVTMIALRGFAVALGLAVFQELLFRGIAQGIFLRAMRPVAAIGLTALLFAFVHFLNPPPGLNVPDPDASRVGFELLDIITARFFDPLIVLGTFAPLFALGAVLAYARWRTASLCLPIGLHTGWIFVNSLVGSMTVAANPQDSTRVILADATLQQGLLPLAGIIVAGLLTNYLTSTDAAADAPA